ncbi:MAG TPA: hypothetical protein VK452_10150 [Dissulfurispiraceae bacterium]|nr:hypothetical protein [Dissulfurispiraceae bacterium]
MQLFVTKRNRKGQLVPALNKMILIVFSVAAFFSIVCNGSLSAEDKKADSKPATSIEEERLKILRADLQAQIEQLKKLKQEMEALQKGLEGKRLEQFNKVVKMFESMSAEEAAKAMEKLDDDTASQILSSMKPRSSGKIMGQLDPSRAAALSKKIIVKGRGITEKTSP